MTPDKLAEIRALTKRPYRDIADAAVVGSYVPDLLDEIEVQFSKGYDQAVNEIIAHFEKLAQRVPIEPREIVAILCAIWRKDVKIAENILGFYARKCATCGAEFQSALPELSDAQKADSTFRSVQLCSDCLRKDKR